MPTAAKTFLLVTCLVFTQLLFAQRKHYSGSTHTTSHGGTFKGGSGSSHKGGTYKLKATNNHYGKHKK